MTAHDTSPGSILGRVATLTRDILARNGIDRNFGPDDALVDIGLTSLDLVNLMLAVESEFDILIPPAHLSPTNFASTGAVARMIGSVLADSEALEHA